MIEEIIALRDQLAKMQAERDKYRNELIEWCDWKLCESCGQAMSEDEFIADIHGNKGVFRDTGEPVYCPACAKKLGWFCECDEDNYHENNKQRCSRCGQEKPVKQEEQT